jgi:aryl-alcohol dehydrogenase-like predicted oxidoreductase
LLGFTTYGGDVPAIRSVIESGRFDLINGVFNALNPSSLVAPPSTYAGPDYGQVMALAHRRGLAVWAIRVLAQGELLAGPWWEEPALRRYLADGFSPAQVVTRFVLSHEAISAAVVGISNDQHLEEAVAAANAGRLDAEAMQALERVAFLRVIE